MSLLVVVGAVLYVIGLWKWVLSKVHLDAAKEARLWKDDGKLAYWWHFFVEMIGASMARLIYFHLVALLLGAVCYGAYLLLDSVEVEKLDVVIFLLVVLIVMVASKRG